MKWKQRDAEQGDAKATDEKQGDDEEEQ